MANKAKTYFTQADGTGGVFDADARPLDRDVRGMVKRADMVHLMDSIMFTSDTSGGQVDASPDELNAVADVSGAGAVRKLLKYDIPQSALTGSEVSLSTAGLIPANVIVRDAFLAVATGRGATATLEVGTIDGTNDPDGILDAVDIETAGIIVPGPTTTTGLNETYISGMTFGALTHLLKAGSDDAGEVGSITPRANAALAGDTISVTSSGNFSSGTDPGVTLFLVVDEIDADLLP